MAGSQDEGANGLTRMVMRGLAKRCPLCGNRKVFESWGRMVHACGRCGHVFERDEGYWVGAIIVNTAVTEILFFSLFIATLVVMLPDVPWQSLLAVAVATNLVFPIAFYPFSKTVWVAFDSYFNRSHTELGTR